LEQSIPARNGRCRCMRRSWCAAPVDSTRASYFFFEMAAPHPVPRGRNPFQQRVSAGYDALPPQLRLVGQWVMDHPREVALLSTREQARRIAVPAATMTRFAQRLGFAGYDEVRRIHADNVRRLPV